MSDYRARILTAAYWLLGACVSAWGTVCASGLFGPSRRTIWRERLGYWDGEGAVDRGCVWLHAASVGEVAAARPLLRALRARLPRRFLLVTCNTETGRRAAEALDCDAVRYLPIDFAPIVSRMVREVEPSLFVFVETEIWPGLLSQLDAAEVPTAMINARISDRSYPGYQRIESLVRKPLAGIDVVCVRDSISEERLIALGAQADRTRVVGDMKLDALAPSVVEKTEDLLASLGAVASADAPILIAASTRRGEEPLVLDAFERVLERHGGARLVLAPRHPDRFDHVAQLLAERRHAFVRRSDKGTADQGWRILLLDTVGELRSCFKGATAAFVGGSLVPVGGHNVLEPAAFSVPVVVGPHLEDVREPAVALADAGALRVVNDSSELAEVWGAWLSDPDSCRRAGRSGAACVAAGRGAVQEAMEELEPLLVQRRTAGPR